ncbi:hypothetical protein RISK_002279 [Rhodopirellula islandica]|uniref:Uncharacterized protein n=1 Tax=Rhodopirellula islandica TaxID=595434 RepID=A0A0J1BGH7_RHOIS|nr:hypothetical protein RISK_002279 [Rhodopirellula islandica]
METRRVSFEVAFLQSVLLANGHPPRSQGHRPWNRERREIGWPTANINPHVLD